MIDNIFYMYVFVFPLAGYLAGTIPSGLLIGLSRGVDVRTAGSKNIGATNVARVVGKRWGAITLVADVLKGFLPVVAARTACVSLPDAMLHDSMLIVALTGFAAVAGHCFSVFLRFRGGKGVATAVGVFLAVCPVAVLGAFVIFYLSMKKWRIVSVSSLLSSIVAPVLIHFFCNDIAMEIMAWSVAAVIWIKHRDNIRRLLDGTEKEFSSGEDASSGRN